MRFLAFRARALISALTISIAPFDAQFHLKFILLRIVFKWQRRTRTVRSFLWPALNEMVLAGTMNGSYAAEFRSSRVSGICVRRARGSTKRCITLPGVNKPRGRGLARGSPLRLRLRLCISSAATATPFTPIYERRPQYPFPFFLSLPLVRPRSSAHILFLSLPLSSSLRDCTKTADTAGWLVTRKLFSPGRTHLEDPPPHRYLF